MRLIDADELLKNWGQTFFAIGGDRLGANGEEIMFYLNSLIREIKNAPTVKTKECPYSCEKCAKKMICELGKEMERPQGEWISVSERLPDTSGHKIVCFVKPQRIDNIYIGLAYFDKGRWVGYLKEDIVAWQPLPEPYMKGGAE